MFGNIRYYCRLFGHHGLWFVTAARIFHNRPVEVSLAIPAIRHHVYLRLNTSDVPTYCQVFVDCQYDLRLSNQPNVIVDAGANVGFASVYFANKYPSARVFAIEPSPSNFELLRRNVRRYHNIVPIRAALWSENVDVELVDPGIGHWGFRTQQVRSGRGHASLGTVRAMTIAGLLTLHHLRYIDILKVDIEGAEKEVFADSLQWIGSVGVIIAELHDRFKTGCTAAFNRATQDFEVGFRKGEHVVMARTGQMAESTLPTRR